MDKPGALQRRPIGGIEYAFRTPDLYDPARARRMLTRQGVRRPSTTEFRVAALRGIEEIAKQVEDRAEGDRQADIISRFYDLIPAIDEDSIDEPDPMKRAEELIAQEAVRQRELSSILPEYSAIEATLERHWPPYAELLADRTFWDDVSRIEIVRLLLREVDGVPVPLDGDDLVTPEAYARLKPEHRAPLGHAAMGLIAPDGAQAKN